METVEQPAAPATPPFDTQALRARLAERRRIPTSTYRLQLHKEFTFRDATALVPYLAQLGIGAVYCSPYLQARPGSTHGYDICDHAHLNPEIGSEEDYLAFSAALQQHGLGQILDFVPNHMAADPMANPWWRDVLENGPSSPYASTFDVDWYPLKKELRGKVLLPILGDLYGVVLERGDLRLTFENGTLQLCYGPLNLPTDPQQTPRILREPSAALDLKAEEDPDTRELLSILTAYDRLPITGASALEQISERRREKEVNRDRLLNLVNRSARVREHIDLCLQAIQGRPGEPESFDALHEFIEAQPYRLAYWKTAFHEINYRRFFDINELAAIRMEDPAVFQAAHPLILRLIRQGHLTGLRLDHLDGLYDPEGYLERLQTAVVAAHAEDLLPQAPSDVTAFRTAIHTWRESERQADPESVAVRPLYLVAEKILSADERLPTDWALHGTSGYDFLNDLNRLFVSDTGLKQQRTIYERFIRHRENFELEVYECKKLITETALASELNVLAHALNRISERSRRSRDFTLDALREALREVVACFGVYRTYLSQIEASDADRKAIDHAILRSRRLNPAMAPTIFTFIRSVLLPQTAEGLGPDEQRLRLGFAMKFQQYTGPVHAKGVEDTSFYRFNLLASLNEVGSEPHHGGLTPEKFHESNQRRREQWRYGMLTTATHDTKRGEDVRARLHVLSEMPQLWNRILSRWSRLTARCRTVVDGEHSPSHNDEYLFYQTLLGLWPAEPPETEHTAAPAELVARLQQYMLKAIKEAKVHTSWISPNEAYDQAMRTFVEQSLTGKLGQRFLEAFLPFQREVAWLGCLNSLAQGVLKIASPGVPDVYRGTELWDLSLVDPDNRRPVDFPLRQKLLDECLGTTATADRGAFVAELLRTWYDGRIKLYVLACGLRLRREQPDLLLEGDYHPLTATGDQAEHVVAFLRRTPNQQLLVVAPRLMAALISPTNRLPCGSEAWGQTRLRLPQGTGSTLTNVLTGEKVTVSREGEELFVPMAEVLRGFPVGVFLVGGDA